jgi:RNA polymerase sigma-70 factor (ECF subfamily)
MWKRGTQKMVGDFAGVTLMTEYPRLDGSTGDRTGAAIAYVIEQAKEGDSYAFEQLITSYQHRVVATAWRMLGNQEDARDAAQEVFLRVYRYLKKFRSGEDFSAWLYRITINVCRDAHRRRGPVDRFASLESDRELGNLPDAAGSDDVEAAAILSQEQAIIASALDMLSPKEREAIVLRDLEGLSTEEVAKILGSSATTVRSQISSSRAKIKLYRDRLLNRRRRKL